MLQLAALHDKSREGKVEYNEFINAKKWINKNYLMSAFEGKKKKKKKGKKGGKKKGKFKLVMPICMQDEGPRTHGGGPPELYIPRHIHFTDTGRFDRDNPPKHPLQVSLPLSSQIETLVRVTCGVYILQLSVFQLL